MLRDYFKKALLLAGSILSLQVSQAKEPPLTAETRFVPGVQPTNFLRYKTASARDVHIAGSWNDWGKWHPLFRQGGEWVIDVASFNLPFGRYEYKFIVDGTYEPGVNRYFYINEQGQIQRPSETLKSVSLQDANTLHFYFFKPVNVDQLRFQFSNGSKATSVKEISPFGDPIKQGYGIADDMVWFYFDENHFNKRISPNSTLRVAGSFSHFNSASAFYIMQDDDRDGLWKHSMSYENLRYPRYDGKFPFKYVADAQDWISPPRRIPEIMDSEDNLLIDASRPGFQIVEVKTDQDFSLSKLNEVKIAGADPTVIRRWISPGMYLLRQDSDVSFGPQIDFHNETTTYRLFAPRATEVFLNIYPTYTFPEIDEEGHHDGERYPMGKRPDGVWEITLLGIDTGKYYAFNVNGPTGYGESFFPDTPIGDPYALAVAHAENASIVIDPDAENPWFKGWTDQDYKIPAPEDMVIYETHLRDLTSHPSSKVPEHLRGTYQGLLASEGTGTALDHIRDMGFNMVEFMPMNEFNNGSNSYNWGYATCFFFAPEASFALDPTRGSQYYEFKNLVNELHNRGIGVMIDVVYNHIGGVNVFNMIDKKYYFRLDGSGLNSNFSVCGNDVRTETPLMRKFIVENVLYWIEEFHIDGFRFDLAELIDMETLMEIEKEVRAKHPDVFLVAEPWSPRGHNLKKELNQTTWSSWNNDYREAAKHFAKGENTRDWLEPGISGSVSTWSTKPIQSVNYMESHDDMSLADELSNQPGHNARRLNELDVQRQQLAATVLFTSIGVPMVAYGQEYGRSKRGISNTYDRGDEVNQLNWNQRNEPNRKRVMEYYRDMIALRRSPYGKAFRVEQLPDPAYVKTLKPASNYKLFGYFINHKRNLNAPAFLVLHNASNNSETFEVTLPRGEWKLIGDGEKIDTEGLGNETLSPGKHRLRVPGVTSYIYMAK